MFRTLPIVALLLATACATACAIEVPDAPEPVGLVPTEAPVLTYATPAPVEWSTVEIDRVAPPADELVDEDAAELEGQHAAEPPEADAVPHARLWFHDERGLVAV